MSIVVESDVELCHPTEGPIWAYFGQRAVVRKSTKGEPRHAVGLWARLAVRKVVREHDDGSVTVLDLVEAECGVDCAIELGPWDPDASGICVKCAKFLAGTMPMPADPPVEVPAPAVEEAPVQLQLAFPVAA